MYKSYRDRVWTIFSFPKRNRSIVWDDTNKTYEIYKGVAKPKDDDVATFTDEKTMELRNFKTPDHIKQQDNSHWIALCWILSGALGMTLAILILFIIMK